MCRATIYDARNNFSSFVKIAEGGEPVELTRHDKPVAVIISWEDYAMRKPKESFFEKLKKLKEEYADVLADPTFDGLPLPKREPPSEEYLKKIDNMWAE